MSLRVPSVTLLSLLALAGCRGDGSADTADAALQRRQATERHLEIVVEIARELRDRRGSVQAVAEQEVFAAVRQRHPAGAPGTDVLQDGWSRPLRYEVIHETVGNELRNGFRVVSAGPNGTFDGGGDDLQRETVVAETLRGR